MLRCHYVAKYSNIMHKPSLFGNQMIVFNQMKVILFCNMTSSISCEIEGIRFEEIEVNFHAHKDQTTVKTL